MHGKGKVFFLYTYDLSKVKSSKKVRFVYLLKGRGDEKGLIEDYNGKFLVNGCFIIPEKRDKDIVDVFRMWKIRFRKRKIMLMD